MGEKVCVFEADDDDEDDVVLRGGK